MIVAPSLERFTTPRGRATALYTRPETADHNNVYSCTTEDEYGLRDIELGSGTALDIGAHIGGVTIGLALDNPDAHIIAVEALSANVEILLMNIAANGVEDRVTVIHGAAAKPGEKTAIVRWNFEQTESGQHHRFIANAHLAGPTEGDEETVDAWTLPTEAIAFAKIDCEGCEYDVLRSKAVKNIAEIRGEFHAGFNEVSELLSPTHVVTMTSGTEAFGGFRAVLR